MSLGAIVLVAGMSSRIRGITAGLPKSFLTVGEETLIHRSIRLLRAAGVEDITLVTGFMGDLFRSTFPNCKFVHNNEFKSTNTSVSLAMALNARQGHPDESLLVINGDVYFADRILTDMVANQTVTQAAVNRHSLSEEEVKVFADGDRVSRIGKHLNEDSAYGEAFGVYLLNPRFVAYMRQELNLSSNPRMFYEESMDRLLQAGHHMRIHDVGDALVQEIDYPEDYQNLANLVK